MLVLARVLAPVKAPEPLRVQERGRELVQARGQALAAPAREEAVGEVGGMAAVSVQEVAAVVAEAAAVGLVPQVQPVPVRALGAALRLTAPARCPESQCLRVVCLRSRR